MDASTRVYRNTRDLPVEVAIVGRETARLEPGEEMLLERAQMFSWAEINVLVPAGEAAVGFDDGNFRNLVFDGEIWKLWNVLPAGPPGRSPLDRRPPS
jgi:hypothetical protein